MKILVVNAGSSSLKFQLFDMENEKILAKGNCEKVTLKNSFVSYKKNGKETVIEGELKDHTEAIEKVLALLIDKELGVIADLKEISAVGHRVVQGGWIFKNSVIVDQKVLDDLATLDDLAPVHAKANRAGIIGCIKSMPTTPQVLVFDTAFHATIPEKAFTYGIDYNDTQKFHIRKYGFHGTSHRFVLNETAKLLNKKPEDVNMISCHLGNGSSLTAIKNGKSIDTTMGLTPLDGIFMGTRCGQIDPSVVGFLCEKKGISAKECMDYLNKQCGILGVSGVSSDMRELNKAIESNNERAKLALEMLCYSVKKNFGSYLAILGNVDAVVFTGGVGENQEDLREDVMCGLENFGIIFDKQKNLSIPRGTIELLSKPESKIHVFRVPTDEELMIARDTKALVTKK